MGMSAQTLLVAGESEERSNCQQFLESGMYQFGIARVV